MRVSQRNDDAEGQARTDIAPYRLCNAGRGRGRAADFAVDVGRLVKHKQLPQPYLIGPNHDIKRWRWSEIERRIVGDESGEDDQPYFRGLARGAA